MLIINYAEWKINGNWLPVKSSQMKNLLFMNVIYRPRTGLP